MLAILNSEVLQVKSKNTVCSVAFCAFWAVNRSNSKWYFSGLFCFAKHALYRSVLEYQVEY